MLKEEPVTQNSTERRLYIIEAKRKMGQFQHLHDHPLLFNEDYSEDWSESQVFCWACEDAVPSGPIYNCSDCYLYLHKSCAELPLKLEHSFHSEHPLTLLAESPYRGGYVCNACRQERRSFVYHCGDCQFDLDIKCALLGPKASSLKRKGDTEFLHFSHEHPLIFKDQPPQNNDEEEDVACSGCHRVISDPFYYDCYKCDFGLHKSCAELPRLAHLPIHPQHPLLLFNSEDKTCTRCSRSRSGFFYECKTCELYVDVGCSLLRPDTCFIERRGNREIKHLSHGCLLTLEEEVQKYAGQEHYCALCSEILSAPYYDCSECKFSVHKTCAELPSFINCYLHSTDHPLLLLHNPKCQIPCHFCGWKSTSFSYFCYQCNFGVDIRCSLSFSNVEESHKHDFTIHKQLMDFTCQICGIESRKRFPWQCRICNLFAHKECAQSPTMLSVRQHPHKLNLIYSFEGVVDQSDNSVCKLCYKKVDVKYAAYYCSQCKYAAHLECARMLRIVDMEYVFSEENRDLIASLDLLCNHYDKFMSDSIFKTKLEEEEKGQRIQHFSHDHYMTLNDENLAITEHCDGCARPISAPYYSCGECKYYLHRTCGEVPNKQIQHPLHFHPLTLMSVGSEDYDFIFKCKACKRFCHGFRYMCEDCDFQLDIRCASVGVKLKHPLHEHFLFPPFTRKKEKCSACGLISKLILVCAECEFVMDYKCATLPQVARHRYDKHILKLTNISRNDCDEYYCEICEEERVPNYWHYYCEECDFSTHINCILGEYPYLKRGATMQYDYHSHPLTIVEEATNNYAKCKGCGKNCYTLSVECAPCKFQFHLNDDCPNNIEYSSDSSN